MIKSTLAREDDGTIQINFEVPQKEVNDKKVTVVKEMAKTLTVAGFRKGKVPVDVAEKNLDPNEVLQHALQHILPKAFANSIKEHKIKPAIYPKFEITNDKDPMAIRAITCEILPFDVGDYKKLAQKVSGQTKDIKEKENKVLEALLESVKVIIPKVLIEEELNQRLSSLLSRLEKLGLSLESYLASVKKTPEELRKSYEDDAKKTIAIELILGQIAEKEKIKVDPQKIDEAYLASGVKDENQKYIIESILKKRAVLDSLVS
ncbi:hypothetical protein HYS03_02760 [Candidatus Woesebacteria bacterium]|nr:hypothetical protein [Candidatus Woesebacteria bacterium]QQG47241.1 MAG: hypothetical protein HY044_03890 [Candidatus Woesebacteria bacterium]